MKSLADNLKLLEALGTTRQDHSETMLYSHLLGTYDILAGWGLTQPVCYAGLFHSIYGTDSFSNDAFGSISRHDLRHAIGREAEALVYLFCARSSESFWNAIETMQTGRNTHSNRTFTVIDRFCGEEIECTKRQLENISVIILANALDQLPRLHENANLSHLTGLLTVVPTVARDAFEIATG